MANTTVFHPFPPLTGNEAAFQPPGPHVYQLIITTTVFTVLAIACVSGRVFSKTRGPNVPKWGWDDSELKDRWSTSRFPFFFWADSLNSSLPSGHGKLLKERIMVGGS